MSVWQHCLRRAAKRTLELIVLQFLVVVILPDNAVGTQDLPAVGAKKVACRAASCSVAPSGGEPAALLDPIALDRTMCIGDHSLALSQHPANYAAEALQFSRRLRI
jgi:hypothetical protein